MIQTPHPDAFEVLNTRFSRADYGGVLEHILGWRRTGHRGYIAITNPHSVMLARRDEAMRQATAGADLRLPDGVGVILAANLLRRGRPSRVTGPQLMLHLCDRGREVGLRHFFHGGREGVAEQLADRLRVLYPGLQVAGTCCPPFHPLDDRADREIVERINATKPDIVWVGLGAPKQEKWMARHAGQVHAPAMIGVGAAFDFHSGHVKWAPAWVRKSGLEWLYRLVQEPGRMWRRNVDSALFAMAVLAERLGAR